MPGNRRPCQTGARHTRLILLEKPFAANLAEADRLIAACVAMINRLAINWPLACYPPHITTRRMIDDGTIGTVPEVPFHEGNRGPLSHLADKVEVSREEAERQKPGACWFKAASGGGSLMDYPGYGATLGTWFLNGEAPLKVTAVTWAAPGLEVDEHAICVLRVGCPGWKPAGAPLPTTGRCNRSRSAGSWWWGPRAPFHHGTTSRGYGLGSRGRRQTMPCSKNNGPSPAGRAALFHSINAVTLARSSLPSACLPDAASIRPFPHRRHRPRHDSKVQDPIAGVPSRGHGSAGSP